MAESYASDSKALELHMAYYRAWTEQDFDLAMTFIDDDIVCDAPAGRLSGAQAFRGFMEPFSRVVTRINVVAAFGDEQTAVLVYDADTLPVKNAPGAECVTVVDGLITYMRIIFDRQPFTTAREAGGA